METATPQPLHRYLEQPEPDFAWRQVGRGHWRMASQRWQGVVWNHDVTLTEGKGDLAVLIVTGGDPNDLDLEEQRLLAEMSELPVATLFHVPNQPLFDLWEDDLIAFTFQQYLETGDSSWPLLLPMVKSVVQAMESLRTATNIRRFVVTGLSKRGWTTWLTAASGNPLVAGIAPMVIDNLNLEAQMRHQLATWGSYSEQLEAYTELGLQERLGTSTGTRLAEIVDPYAYRQEIVQPTLIVNGTNDPYWQVDALSHYWDDLRQPKWASIVPNAGHLLGDKVQWHEVLVAFAAATAGRFGMPSPTFSLRRTGDMLSGRVEHGGPASLWVATSDTLDFRESQWEAIATGQGPFDVPLRAGLNTAALLSARYVIEGLPFTLTGRVGVFPSPRR